jgi:DNA polymerase
MPMILHRDYETRSALDLTEVGVHRYVADATTDIWCCCYAVNDDPVELWVPGDPVPFAFIEAARRRSWRCAAFADSFERTIERSIMGPRYGFPEISSERHICVQAMALTAALPAKLKTVAQALGLRHQKASDKTMLKMARPRRPRKDEDPAGLYWCDDAADREALYAYCKQDVEVERELHGRLAELTPGEAALYRLSEAVNDRGFFVDGDLLDAAARIAQAADAEIERELHEATGGEIKTIGQVDAIIAWLAAHGCEVPDLRRKTVSAALRRVELQPAARKVLALRRSGARASANKLTAMRGWRAADGRIRGAFRYHGTATGRWSSLGVQVQNLKRPEIDDPGAAIEIVATGELEAVRRTYPEKPVLEIIGDISRALPCAPPSRQFLCADFSGIESRLAAWLAGERSKVEAWARFDATGDPQNDPYYRFGTDRLGLPPELARKAGKVGDLAFSYMGGCAAYRNFADDDATDEEILQKRNAWRSAHPRVVRLWHMLDEMAVAAVRAPGKIQAIGRRIAFDYDGTFLRLRLPSGRKISYPFPTLQEAKFGGQAVSFMDSAEGKWSPCRHGQGAYGGLWCENLVSGTARDIFAEMLTRLEAAGFAIVLHAHDEVVVEVPETFDDLVEFERLVLERPAWAADLPLAAGIRSGKRFCKITPPPADPPPADDLSQADTSQPADDPRPFDPELGATAPEDEAPPEPGKGNGRADDETFRAYTSANRQQHGRGYKVAEWIYRWVDGTPYLRVDRMQSAASAKWYPQHHWAHGAWQSGAPAGPHIPYRLPELAAAARQGGDVHVGEGEAVCEALAGLGLVATTNSGGAGKWWSELARWLSGFKRAFIHEDNDEVGRKHAARVAAALAGIVPELRIVSYRELPEKGDVKDWLAAGHTREELTARCEAAAALGSIKVLDIRAWDHEPVPEQQWSVPERFPLKQTALFSGEGAVGKGYIMLQLACAQALGGVWLDIPLPQGPALFIDAEDDANVLHYRSAGIAKYYGATYGQLADGGLHLVSWVGEDAVLAAPERHSSVMQPTALYRRLLEMAGDIKPRIISIASTSDVFAGNENDRGQVRQFNNLLNRVAIAANGTVVLTSHPSLTGINTGTGISGTTQWHNGPRARAVMSSVKPVEGEPCSDDLRKIEFHKNQYGRLEAAIYVRWQGGLYVPVTAAVADEAEREAARMRRAETVFLELLRRYTAQNQKLSPHQSRTGAASVFARDPEAAGLTYQDFQAAQQRLINAGRIAIETEGPPSKSRDRLVIND